MNTVNAPDMSMRDCRPAGTAARRVLAALLIPLALHLHANAWAAALSQETCDKLALIDWSSQQRTAERLRRSYLGGDFAAVDKAMACLISTPHRFAGGEAAASAVYWAFRAKTPSGGTPEEEAARIAAWHRATPGSIFAKFAALRSVYDTAWRLRGTGAAASVNPASWDGFGGSLAVLEGALNESSPELRDTAIWHNLMLATATDSPRPRSDPNMVFSRAVQRWPTYFDFHEVMLSRLVPRWGGSWPEVDAFVLRWTAGNLANEGESLYARLYVSVLRRGYRPQETLVDARLMENGLRDWIRRYPTIENLNTAASAACLFENVKLFRETYSRLSPDEVTPATWMHQAQRGPCESRFAR